MLLLMNMSKDTLQLLGQTIPITVKKPLIVDPKYPKKGQRVPRWGTRERGLKRLIHKSNYSPLNSISYNDPDDMEYEETATNDEQAIPKKRKGTDADDSATSDAEFVAREQDPILTRT